MNKEFSSGESFTEYDHSCLFVSLVNFANILDTCLVQLNQVS